jgi:hypothetical protein
MDAIKTHVIDAYWQSPEQKAANSGLWGALASYWSYKSDMKVDMLIHRTTEMIQIWADLTMMYQGDFIPLTNFYRNLRERHVPFPSQRDKKYFDDLR